MARYYDFFTRSSKSISGKIEYGDIMNLDNFRQFEKIDKSQMIEEIRNLPDQLESSWVFGSQYQLPEISKIDNVIFAGMGGSAIGADLLASYAYHFCPIPTTIVRDYQLPHWVKGERKLVVCSSHSGNTEETLSIFKQSIENNCAVMAVTTGGKLKTEAELNQKPCWLFNHSGQPRSAVGFSFGLLFCLFSRLGLISDSISDIRTTIKSMRSLINNYDIEKPVINNLAKRLAGQAMGRYPIVIGAEHLEPVARRWKTQFNELAKTWSQFECIPEADHNTLAGTLNPELILTKLYSIFLQSPLYHLKNQKRIELTSTEFMVAGICTDKVFCNQDNRLTEMWGTIVLGDFVSYYLAMAYGVDPTPIDALKNFKHSLI